MLIGMDFDNTLVSYDHLFVEEAAVQGWFSGDSQSTKKDVRDAVRGSGECGEERWQLLQARVYAHRMADALLMDGAEEFLRRCRAKDIPIVIISHKPKYARADSDRIDLRDAALSWLDGVGFFSRHGFRYSREQVFFEESQLRKITRIELCGCTDFIDDLEEVFQEQSFPNGVRRHLFAAQKGALPEGPFAAYRSWREIGDAIV